MLQWLSALGGIILVDLILSGDNALVIGATASSLPRRQRWLAIVIGGAAAIVLRICFASLATYLFQVPFLGVGGGIILIFIALHLLVSRSKDLRKPEDERQLQEDVLRKKGSRGLMASVLTILIADATMSLDNILAVGAIAEGDVFFLVLGLTISIILLLVGSALIAEIIDHLPWLLDIACLVLAYTAAHIFLGDDAVQHFFDRLPIFQVLIIVLALAIVLGADIYLRIQDRKFRQNQLRG